MSGGQQVTGHRLVAEIAAGVSTCIQNSLPRFQLYKFTRGNDNNTMMTVIG